MKPSCFFQVIVFVFAGLLGWVGPLPLTSAQMAKSSRLAMPISPADGESFADSIAGRIDGVLKQVNRNARVVTTQRLSLEATTQLFVDSISSAEVTIDLKQRWATQGFVLESLANGEIMLVHESPERAQGRGVYAWRTTKLDRPLVLQAPHRFFDRRTGQIVLRAFAEHPVQAACWNSVHRRQTDLAHRPQHEFNAFTKAIANIDPQVTILQLHGFDPSQRRGSAAHASAIISDSTRYPGRPARQIALDLKGLWGKTSVLLYPIETAELGGTRNAQASLLHSIGFDRFIHLELAPEPRDRLAREAQSRARWLAALMDSD